MKTRSIHAPKGWQQLTHHPLSALVEFGAGIDMDQLVAHMRANGYDPDEAIILYEGMILDGRHRHAAAIQAEVLPTFKVFEGPNAFQYVYKKALRQHLNESQRAILAATLAKHNVGRPAAEITQDCAINPSQAEAAKSLNVSHRLVNAAQSVLSRGTEALQEAVREGNVTVTDAAKVAHEPPAVQDQAVKAVANGQARTAAEAINTTRPPSPSNGPILCRQCRCFSPKPNCPDCAEARAKAARPVPTHTPRAPREPKNGAQVVDWRAILGALQTLHQAPCNLYRHHGVLTRWDKPNRDAAFERMGELLEEYRQIFARRYEELAKEKAPLDFRDPLAKRNGE